MNEISSIGEKKIHDHQRKTQENYNFLTKKFLFPGPKFHPRIYSDCNSS